MKHGFSEDANYVEQLFKLPGRGGSESETYATFEKARVLHTDRG